MKAQEVVPPQISEDTSKTKITVKTLYTEVDGVVGNGTKPESKDRMSEIKPHIVGIAEAKLTQ